VLICYERKVLLTGCWWPICSDGWFVLRDKFSWLVGDKSNQYREVVLCTRLRRTRTTGPSIEARRRRPPDMAPARPNGRSGHGFRWPSAPVAGQMPCLRPAATRPTGPRVPAMAPRQLEQIDDDAACCVPPLLFLCPSFSAAGDERYAVGVGDTIGWIASAIWGFHISGYACHERIIPTLRCSSVSLPFWTVMT
jgi:hypothetical protein